MSALSGIDIALWDLKGIGCPALHQFIRLTFYKARRLNVPLYELLGGLVRNKCQVYCWIGGDRPADVEAAAYVKSLSMNKLRADDHSRKVRKSQGLTCVKMNATEDVNWLDMPSVLDSTVERLKTVKALGLDVGLDFHGRLHKRRFNEHSQ